MVVQKEKETDDATLINKTVPMGQNMITEIHKVMKEHLETKDRPLSFGEAARRLIKAGLDQQEKTG